MNLIAITKENVTLEQVQSAIAENQGVVLKEWHEAISIATFEATNLYKSSTIADLLATDIFIDVEKEGTCTTQQLNEELVIKKQQYESDVWALPEVAGFGVGADEDPHFVVCLKQESPGIDVKLKNIFGDIKFKTIVTGEFVPYEEFT